MTMTECLIAVTDRFGALAGISRSRLSTKLLNDGKGLDRIAAGGDLLTGSYERSMRWLSDNWPADVEWPAGVERPAPQAGREAV